MYSISEDIRRAAQAVSSAYARARGRAACACAITRAQQRYWNVFIFTFLRYKWTGESEKVHSVADRDVTASV